jgi:regulatory protein
VKIELQPNLAKRELRTILIDGEPWKEIHTTIFGKRSKLPKSIDSMEEWHAQFEALEYRQAKNYALWRLSMQSYYSRHLAKLMRERLVSFPIIERVLKECLSSGYLNDEAWLDSFMRVQTRRYSLRAIAVKLQTKGVPPDVAEELLEKWRNPEGEREVIRRLLQTRYRSRDLADYKEKQKVMAALARKGYGFELIQSVLRETPDED